MKEKWAFIRLEEQVSIALGIDNLPIYGQFWPLSLEDKYLIRSLEPIGTLDSTCSAYDFIMFIAMKSGDVGTIGGYVSIMADTTVSHVYMIDVDSVCQWIQHLLHVQV